MSDDPLKESIEALDRAIQQKEVELEGLRRSRVQLAGQVGALAIEPTSTEWAGKGITEAAILFLTEAGNERGTREIADTIRRRGVRTTSRNYVATVYATLKNATKKFRRTQDGNWALKTTRK